MFLAMRCIFITAVGRTGNMSSGIKIFHDHAYDPVSDVEIDPVTGLFQWSAAAGS